MTAKVSFQVTTYYKRPRSEPGLTRVDSVRLSIGAALMWALRELPVEAWNAEFDKDANRSVITIDWAKVPAEIQDGLS
jgi:hypothetical protein